MITAVGSVIRAANPDPHLTWTLVQDVRQVLEYPFMVNAFRAGTIVAVLAGAVGWFMVLRRQAFVGHTLALVGFPGATGALLLGVSATYGLFAFAVMTALLLAVVPGAGAPGYSEESALTGTIQAFALACGFLFINLDGGCVGSIDALLFGSFPGLSAGQGWLLLRRAAVPAGALVGLARQLVVAPAAQGAAAARAGRASPGPTSQSPTR